MMMTPADPVDGASPEKSDEPSLKVELRPPIDDARPSDLHWICVRTQPKREHFATAHIRMIEGVEVFCPRVRYEKMTRRGKVWFNEAVFPNYLFVKLDLALHQRAVASAQSVSGIVRFGLTPSIVPQRAIDELRAEIPNDEAVIHHAKMEPGATALICNPLFFGLRGVITQVIPARERVKVLLEFLGRCSEVEIPVADALVEGKHILDVRGGR
jgi:transcriptional antiterminator RfaH